MNFIFGQTQDVKESLKIVVEKFTEQFDYVWVRAM